MIQLSFPFKVDTGVRKIIWLQLAPSLNIQLREHFAVRDKRKKIISDFIRVQMGKENFTHGSITKTNKKTGKAVTRDIYTWKNTPLSSVHILYERHSCSMLDPIDNFGSSFKSLGDAIVDLGIIVDDASNCIKSFAPKPTKVSKKKDQKIVIKIWTT